MFTHGKFIFFLQNLNMMFLLGIVVRLVVSSLRSTATGLPNFSIQVAQPAQYLVCGFA